MPWICQRHISSWVQRDYSKFSMLWVRLLFLLRFQDDFSFIFLYINIWGHQHICPMETEDILLPQIHWAEAEKLEKLHLSCALAATCFSPFWGWCKLCFFNVGRNAPVALKSWCSSAPFPLYDLNHADFKGWAENQDEIMTITSWRQKSSMLHI